MRNRLSENSGFSMIEALMAMGLLIGIVFVSFSYFSNSADQSTLTVNNGARLEVLKQMNGVIQSSIGAVSHRGFDPTKTFYAEGTNNPTLANTWTFGPPLPAAAVKTETAADTLSFTVAGTNFKQDSSLLEVYRIRSDAAGIPYKETLYAIISRCIDAKNNANPTALASILTLPRPTLVNGELYCCREGGACPDASIPAKEFWPTIFMFLPNGTLKSIPSDGERTVVPGAGFFAYFNRARNPDQLTVLGYILENRCRLTKTGYGKRSPNQCAGTGRGGFTTNRYFDSDLYFLQTIKENKPTVSDITGSGYIKIGG